jgi:hypothetical protein
MTEIFPFPTPPPASQEVQVANGLLAGMNQELQRRVEIHARNFHYLWNRGEGQPTADQIVSAMGTNAALFFALASMSARQIEEAAGLIGKTLNDFMPESDYKPPATVIINQDGTVTLQWPAPPPPPEPDPVEPPLEPTDPPTDPSGI